jgi:hypothetical protein
LGNAATGSSPFSQYGGASELQLVTDSNGDSALKINVPWGAFTTPEVQFRIPVSMADTFVEEPQTSDIQVHATWPDGSRSGYGVGAQATMSVALTQLSSVTSSGQITVTSSDPRFSVYPLTDTETMAPNSTKDIAFTISNTGGTANGAPVTLTVDSYDVYSGALESTDSITGIPLATIGSNQSTTLTIHIQDNTTASNPLEGVGMQIQWPPSGGQSQELFTNSQGDATTALQSSGGGGYTGQVYIVTMTDNDAASKKTYASVNDTVTVQPGPNEVTLILGSGAASTKKTAPLNWVLVALVAVIVLIVIAFSGVIAYVYKQNKHSPVTRTSRRRR